MSGGQTRHSPPRSLPLTLGQTAVAATFYPRATRCAVTANPASNAGITTKPHPSHYPHPANAAFLTSFPHAVGTTKSVAPQHVSPHESIHRKPQRCIGCRNNGKRIIRSQAPMPQPPLTTDPPDSSPPTPHDSTRACKSSSSQHSDVPGAPVPSGCRARPPAGASRTNVERYDTSPASPS